MKILSWNVNGIRAAIKKDFLGWLKIEKPDVLCVQEIKIAETARKKEFSEVLDPQKTAYEVFWNSAERPGYSGTAIFVKKNLVLKKSVTQVPSLGWDDEGRILILDMGKFYLTNVYFPNSNHELTRLDFKIKFNDKLLRHLKLLEKKKPIIVCGDFNVAHEEIDLARPKENVGNPGFHPRERVWMNKFLQKGFVDTFRDLHPDEQKFSWWSYRAGARKRNVGWRIDYFCASKIFMSNIKKAFIQNEVMGSDHCPVGVELR